MIPREPSFAEGHDLETQLQEVIQAIYRLDATPSVANFRIDFQNLERILGRDESAGRRETLIVRESGEHVDVALYISDEVVTGANTFVHAGTGSERAPVDPHLDAFCVAAEGVSHFVYLTFCGAQQERPVTQIELEIQAEIDKYLILRLLFPIDGDRLLSRLFDRIQLVATNGHEERYAVANRAGRRYARWLNRRFARGRGDRALEDARALYRKPLAAKLEHIDRAA